MIKKEFRRCLSLCSEYFDLYKPTKSDNTLDFYLQYAHNLKKEVERLILLPMCGTGHFLLPFIEAGFNVHGFDSSEFMLQILQQKCVLKNLTPKIWKCGFQDFNAPYKYKLTILPKHTFNFIIDLEEAKNTLKIIWKHLENDGIFVFDAETPQSVPCNLGVWNGSVRERTDGKKIILSYCITQLEEQISNAIYRYDLVDSERIIKTEIESFKNRLYERGQLYSLIQDAGFSSIKIIKAFKHGQSVEDGDKIIVYECRK